MVNTYDNYYDAIDAEGVGATVNIGGKLVKAETADGYQGKGNSGGSGSSGNSGGNIVTNYAGSHGLDNASYSVGADGKGQVTGGITDQGFWQSVVNFPKVAILSLTDPVAAAELNPYWNPNPNYDPNAPEGSPNRIAGNYDKFRDVNGDGVPDYDSSGNTINPSDFATWENGGNYKVLTDANGKITGYQKVKADGTADNDPPTNAAGQPVASDFDVMAAEAEANAEKKLSEMSYADLIDAGYTEQQAKDILEGKFVLNPQASLSTQTEDIKLTEGEGTIVDSNADKFNTDIEGLNIDATTAGDATTVTNPTQPGTEGYTAETVSDEAATMKVDTTKGKVNAEDLVDPDGYLIDMDGVATGVNKDGSINQTGVAIANYANQSLTTVIDTSTLSGQAAAAALGEGNYIDSKATTQGQIAILSKYFVDANGNPKIPAIAQRLARTAERTMSMNGVTGTAKIEAMSKALMEAMLPIASEDAAFFQTLTTKNLDNKQEAIINKAKVLARFDEINLSARETAAVQNAKHFFEMNLENLTIENEHAVIEFQGRLDALFEDAKAINTERMFTAEETNDANQFWGELGVRVQEYNATAIDTMKRWNAGEINDISEFNATMQNNREEFYKNMQYNIEIANARWRQTIMETNTQNKFDAAAEDARNMFGITKASLDQIWDTVDLSLIHI